MMANVEAPNMDTLNMREMKFWKLSTSLSDFFAVAAGVVAADGAAGRLVGRQEWLAVAGGIPRCVA